MRRLKALLASPGFNIFVGFLIIISVGLLGYEVFAKPDGVLLGRILLIQDLILILLVMELGLRWKASPSTAAFFRKHWLEILAILPMLRVFRLGRIAILLRLVQLLSFGAIFQRRLSRL